MIQFVSSHMIFGLWYMLGLFFVCSKSEPPCMVTSPRLQSIIFACLLRGSDIFSCQKGILFSFEASRRTTKEGEKTTWGALHFAYNLCDLHLDGCEAERKMTSRICSRGCSNSSIFSWKYHLHTEYSQKPCEGFRVSCSYFIDNRDDLLGCFHRQWGRATSQLTTPLWRISNWSRQRLPFDSQIH